MDEVRDFHPEAFIPPPETSGDLRGIRDYRHLGRVGNDCSGLGKDHSRAIVVSAPIVARRLLMREGDRGTTALEWREGRVV